MIAALTLMCAVHSWACTTADAKRIAWAIDQATDAPELRAQLVVAAWHESSFRINPPGQSWDSKIGLARGPWQMWTATSDTPLVTQAKRWVWMVARGGYPALCGYGSAAKRMAYRRASEAGRLLGLVRVASDASGMAPVADPH